MKNSIHTPVKQGWGEKQIGMGAYPQDTSFGNGWLPSYQAPTTGAKDETAELLNKWYTFSSQLDPDVEGSIYALFPDLQTPQSVQNYGLTFGMVRVLHAISDKMVNPRDIKTLEQVNKIFSPTAIKIFSQDTGMKPTTGLYEHPKEYGNYEDVY